ncbi:hypothetical protein HPB50_001058 [Hyalomma asiaticum]|uniref:Uncharacterized protein n=1 Tax=Hyalomma asiaticum TaxID=266040 RepID=A0ACB7RPP9_HYAAI|nr:hypothetical protein HPB50_001058 [Hyalomma asiaticum]
MGQGCGKEKVDKATGMTEREKRLVLNSWHAFTKRHHDYGALLFDALFVAHPEYLQLFHKFKGETIEEVRKDPKFRYHTNSGHIQMREHGVTIGMQVNNMIEYVEHPDNMIMLAKSNAEFHTKIKGVKPKHFEVFGEVIIDVLKSKEEKLMTPEAVEAWTKLFHVFNETIAATFAAGPRAPSKLMSSPPSARTHSTIAKHSGSTAPADTDEHHAAKASRSKGEHSKSPKSPASPSKPHLKKAESRKTLKKEVGGSKLLQVESEKK